MMKRLLEVLLSPLGVTTLLLACGFLLAILRRQSRWGYRLMASGAVLYLIFLFSPLAEIVIRSLEVQYAPLVQPEPSLAVERIVILAGYGEMHPSTPVTSNVTAETLCRMAEGIRLYRQFPASKVILSGGTLRQGDQAVASIMADVLRVLGIPAHDILIEDQSQNTYENLVNVKPMIGTQPFVLVTPAVDLPRAMAVAHKLGMHPVAAPACIWTLQHHGAGMSVQSVLAGFTTPSLERLARLQWAFHEYVGYLWYKVLGRV
jgi:uncharacterized SAM-binding protein YcdF (DUF218 family)